MPIRPTSGDRLTLPAPGARAEIGWGDDLGGNVVQLRRLIIALAMLAGSGCQLIPQVAHQPVVHNPFPQLSKVAIAPFFNLSTEPTVDGRQFAEAYYSELQEIQGFEVVPVGVVERAMGAYQLNLNNPEEVRKLANVLGVDAVVVGAVTDFTPFYPPRVAMQVEWYAANPCFHPIPAGYGLPWGTPEEEFIPAPLKLEAEMALARAQLKTQTPPYKAAPIEPPPPEAMPQDDSSDDADGGTDADATPGSLSSHRDAVKARRKASGDIKLVGTTVAVAPEGPELPPNYPDARAFIPPPPKATPCPCVPSADPVLRHARTYNGSDGELTEALSSYWFFKDDGRAGGWQAYLVRSDDYIRFCCHLHIYEMLSARGGGGKTRLVWRWSDDRYMYR